MDKKEERLRELKVKLHDLRQQAKAVAQSLEEVAKEFQEHFKNCHIATIAGSSAGVVGGLIAAVGLGMAVFTVGVSLGLTAVGLTTAGAVIGSAGGVVTAGTSIAESVLRSKAYTGAERLLKTFEQTRRDIVTECNLIIKHLGQDGLEDRFLMFAKFLTRLMGGKAGISIADACELIRNTASAIQQGGEPASKFVLESAGSAGRVTSAVTKITCSTSKAIHVAGGVVGIALIPLDVAFIVNSVRAVAKDEQAETSKKISDMAEKLLEMSPSKGEIDDMINDTIGRLRP